MTLLKRLSLKLQPYKVNLNWSINTYSKLEGFRSALPFYFDYNQPTPLCMIMKNHGSDKGLFQGMGRHNYSTFYYPLFKKKQNKRIRLFELGLGTNNVEITANMGPSGVPGASLRAWKEFFTQGEIFGADIDKSILFSEERISTFFCDQTDQDIINKMWSKNPELHEDFDIIIDDGLHEFEANVCFFTSSVFKLKKGGLYIIEDVLGSVLKSWEQIIKEKWIEEYPDLRFTILEIPNNYNRSDNNLILIERIK